MRLPKSFGFVIILLMLVLSTHAQIGEDTYVYAISKSGDGHIIAVIYHQCDDHDFGVCTIVDFFNTHTGEFIERVDLAPLIPDIIVLDKTGDRLAYSTYDEIGYYDRTTDTQTYLNFASGTSWFAWDPLNSNWLALANGSMLLVVDLLDNNLVTYMRTRGLISRFEWSPDGQYLASSQNNNIVNIWSRSDFNPTTPLDTPTFAVEPSGPLQWHPDGTKLVMLEDPGILIYDLTSNQIVQEIPFDEEIPYIARWSPDGSKIATGGLSMRIWDTSTWALIEQRTYDKTIAYLEWSPDGEHIFHDGGLGGLYRDDMPVRELMLTPEATDEP